MQEVSAKLMTDVYRKQILGEINSWENKQRKFESFKQFEVYHDRANDYVVSYLQNQFSKETLEQMPIVDSVNLAKRIVNKQSSIYNEPPERNYVGLNSDQAMEIDKVYEDNCLNLKLRKANCYLKLQDQSFLWVIPENKELKVKTLLPHQVDVIPNEIDPEKADAVILSVFDRSWFFRSSQKNSDAYNAQIADSDDYRQTLEKQRFLVWTKDINFVMNGLGKTVSEVLPNPIGELPFIDLNQGKETEFFVRGGRALTDFTIQFNGVLSDIYNIVKMQGWAVGYLKAPANLMPNSLVLGPAKLLRLTIDPNNPINPEIGFASPNADIQGSLAFLENLISLFMSSRGMDARAVSTKMQANTFSSGVEKLLSMLDVFEATKEDFETLKRAEKDLFELIKKWSNYYIGTDQQILNFMIPDEATIDVNFCKPELVQSDMEKVNVLKAKLDMGLITKVEAIAQDRGITEEMAEQLAAEMQAEEVELKKNMMAAIQDEQKESMNESEDDNGSEESLTED